MNPLLIFLLIIVTMGLMTIGFGAGIFFLQQYLNPEPSVIQTRLEQLKKINRDDLAQQDSEQSEKNISNLLKSSDYSFRQLGKFLEQYSFTGYIRMMLKQAGMAIPVDRFILFFMITPTLFGMFVAFLFQQPALLLLSVIGAGTPYMLLVFKRGSRLKAITGQLPDTLGLINSSLRAGHSFQSAISMAARELQPPISTELGQVVNDVNLGIPLKDSLEKFGNSTNLPDVQMFVTAVLIQKEAGGNLSEILGKLADTIRDRFKLKGQIAALTGQARLTGMVLGAAPMFLFMVLYLFFPDYVKPLVTTFLGKILLAVAFVMQVIGFLVMRAIINIRI